jgi:hypothetical protein
MIEREAEAMLSSEEKRNKPPNARHGVTMKLEGGKLALHAASEPPADLLGEIQDHTAAIIRHLADKEPAGEGRHASDFSPAELFADNVRKSLLCHSSRPSF